MQLASKGEGCILTDLGDAALHKGMAHSLLHPEKKQLCTGELAWAGVACLCLLVGESQAGLVCHRNLEGFLLFCEFMGKCHTFFLK